MTPTKILIGQALFVIAIIAAAMWAATAYVAGADETPMAQPPFM